jgi:hypothetical protein
MARCGCGGACSCALTAGDNVTVGGSGTPQNPWVVNAVTNCPEVRGCLTAGNGTTYDPTDGSFDVCVSPNAGNSLTRDANGCLFVSPGNNAVMTGCGLDGVGTAADPLRIQGRAVWPFPCDQDSATAQGVYCDPVTGQLHGEAPYRIQTFADSENRLFPNTPLPVPQDTTIYTRTIDVTNNDLCRSADLIFYRDLDVDVTLPPNSQGIIGLDGDDMFSLGNEGSGTIFDTHVQTVKLTRVTFAPGQTQTLSLAVTAWRGSSGSGVPLYNRIQTTFRGWMFTLD